MMQIAVLRFLLSLFLAFLIQGCIRQGHQEVPLEDLPEVEVRRYGQALFRIDPGQLAEGLDSLYGGFGFFLGEEYLDTVNQVQIFRFITEPVNRRLAEACDSRFPDLSGLEVALARGYYHLRSDFPEIKVPAVFTYVSGLLYEQPVQLFDSAAIIALDMYLGRDFEVYKQIGVPYYRIRRMEPEYIVPDFFKEYGYYLAGPEPGRATLLDQMIFHGKVLYLLDEVLAATPDSLKIGFTTEQINWCAENESRLWTMFVEKEILYSTEAFIINKFIQEGPFTSGLPPAAPALTGRWTGWQIVREYMDRNENVSLADLMTTEDAVMILERSGYRPRK